MGAGASTRRDVASANVPPIATRTHSDPGGGDEHGRAAATASLREDVLGRRRRVAYKGPTLAPCSYVGGSLAATAGSLPRGEISAALERVGNNSNRSSDDDDEDQPLKKGARGKAAVRKSLGAGKGKGVEEPVYVCERGCGFEGVFSVVEAHEQMCRGVRIDGKIEAAALSSTSAAAAVLPWSDQRQPPESFARRGRSTLITADGLVNSTDIDTIVKQRRHIKNIPTAASLLLENRKSINRGELERPGSAHALLAHSKAHSGRAAGSTRRKEAEFQWSDDDDTMEQRYHAAHNKVSTTNKHLEVTATAYTHTQISHDCRPVIAEPRASATALEILPYIIAGGAHLQIFFVIHTYMQARLRHIAAHFKVTELPQTARALEQTASNSEDVPPSQMRASSAMRPAAPKRAHVE